MNHPDGDPATNEAVDELKKYVRDIHDFPKKGVIFRDITNLLKNGEVFQKVIDMFSSRFSRDKIDVVCSIEARGFILGAAIAYKLGAGFVPIRKKGKLPWDTHHEEYDLEYGRDELEIHTDAVGPGDNVLLIDDVIATGGTVRAATDLIKRMQGKMICTAFLIELADLKGREKMTDVPVYSLIKY